MPEPTVIQFGRRMRQFLAAVTANVTAAERALLQQALKPAELRLFVRMPLFDQRHSLDVYHTLVRAGHAEPALLTAALLHDCGKVDDNGRPLPLVLYGVFVVLKRLAPRVYEWAARDGRGPLRSFAIHAEHDLRSARMAEAAGAVETSAILRDYARRHMTPMTRALSHADNQN